MFIIHKICDDKVTFWQLLTTFGNFQQPLEIFVHFCQFLFWQFWQLAPCKGWRLTFLGSDMPKCLWFSSPLHSFVVENIPRKTPLILKILKRTPIIALQVHKHCYLFQTSHLLVKQAAQLIRDMVVRVVWVHYPHQPIVLQTHQYPMLIIMVIMLLISQGFLIPRGKHQNSVYHHQTRY